MMRILIIEDEPRAARELSALITGADDTLQVAAITDSVEQTLEWLDTHTAPDLIFSDIQLADGISFEIFGQRNVTSPVIFCTAFDEYLMQAFDTNAVSYVLKPVTAEKVAKALHKFRQLKTAFQPEEQAPRLQQLLHQVKQPYKTALLVHQQEKIIPVQVKDIAFFYLDKAIVHITTFNKQQYFITTSLDDIEAALEPASFYRANRQFLINRAAIANAERSFARKLVARLVVNTPESIVVSKAKASDFLQWLEGC